MLDGGFGGVGVFGDFGMTLVGVSFDLDEEPGLSLDDGFCNIED